MTLDWGKVADTMRGWAGTPAPGWKFGQEDGLRWLADRIATTRGLLIADEVGLGKTRLAVAAMHAVSLAGGRVLVVAPASLLHQWDDERSLFLEALGVPDARPATAEGRHLRHFNDLFKAGCAYPLSKQHPFILASHGFGIPQKIGASTRPYTWALPFIVRSFAQHGIENWGGAKGLKAEASRDERLDLQRRAAGWLAQRCKGLEAAMEALPPLNMEAGAAFSTGGGRETGLRQLLQTLVGRLMGPFDLIVIDEAHKSREELVEGAAPYKRLSNLLEDTNPLVALAKALNVRRYLREVAAGKPARPPHAIGGNDVHDHPLLRACLASMPDDDRERIEAAGDLASLIRASEADYRTTSDRLARMIDQRLPATLATSQRIVIRLAALEWMLDAKPGPEELEARIAGLARDLAAAPMDGEEGGTGSQLARLAETLDAERGYSTLSRSEFARELYGNGTAATKHVLQALFNTSSVRPQVVVAQTRVAAEGLNLHRACRHVLFLHLDWNPATIEQQIGRVDRVGSLWSKRFEEADGAPEPPRIELATIVIEGTTDAERKERILARQRALGAHLFGELLPPDVMRGLSPEWRARLNAASPSFSPRAS